MILRALKWFGWEYLRAFIFCFAIACFVGFLMTLIAYPVQTLTALVLGAFVIMAFLVIFDR